MPTSVIEDDTRLPLEAGLTRLSRTPEELAAAVAGKTEAALARRPDATSWSASEILCHLRDVEELFRIRFHTILGAGEPTLLVLGASTPELARWGIGDGVGHPLDPNRWAEERQYQRQDAGAALDAFRRQRGETVALLRRLSPAQWARGGIHPGRGRMSLAEWGASLAAHDDNHLDQLQRALAGHA